MYGSNCEGRLRGDRNVRGIATMCRGHREFEGTVRKIPEDLASPRSREAVDGRRCAHISVTSGT